MATDTVETTRRELDERLDRAFEGATPVQITAAIDALIAAVRAENDKVRIAADEWQKCAREQATMIEELAERVGQLEQKLADVYPELR